MTSILSTISGYFTKSILLGTLLPVSVFIIFYFVLIRPLLPADLQILVPLAALDPQWQVVLVTLFTVLLSGLIYSLNIPIIQLFEGYPWEKTWFGKRRKNRYKKLYETGQGRVDGMRTLLRATENTRGARISAVTDELKKIRIPGSVPGEWDEIDGQIYGTWNELQLDLYQRFPTQSDLVLPTKLGNVIRSFEYYPHREYQMDAVKTWSRLIAKIDPTYAATIDDAKTSFDFMINLSFLGAVSVVIQLAAGLFYGKPLASADDLLTWLWRMFLTALVAPASYYLSISRAVAWGETVKGAFDLYRKELLAQLGYDVKITSRQQERRIWSKISFQMIFGDGPSGPQAPPYIDPSYLVQAAPTDVKLLVTRGVEEALSERRFNVILFIKNIDEKNRTANDVLITDTLKDNLHYRWESASLNSKAVPVEGSNPYHFKIGDLAPGEEVLLKYKVIRLA